MSHAFMVKNEKLTLYLDILKREVEAKALIPYFTYDSEWNHSTVCGVSLLPCSF